MRISDWSSDVCSSDLNAPQRHLQAEAERLELQGGQFEHAGVPGSASGAGAGEAVLREDRCGLVAPEKIVGRAHGGTVAAGDDRQRVDEDRKSTRLNSSH